MKKIILMIVIVLLVFTTYNTIVNGFDTSFLKIPSYKQLQANSAKIDQGISELNEIIKNYETQQGNVKTAKTLFEQKKQEYDLIANEATDEQLEAAMREEEFLLDYLWILVGNYAEDNNVKFLMQTNSEDYSVDFDVTGSYVSIINFIYDLANDPELRFSINNIILEGGSNQDTVTKAKFTVYGINAITKAD